MSFALIRTTIRDSGTGEIAVKWMPQDLTDDE